jgi:hypothetical protein
MSTQSPRYARALTDELLVQAHKPAADAVRYHPRYRGKIQMAPNVPVRGASDSLCFPGIFRGVLDVQARTISHEMAIAAANEIARYAEEQGLSDAYIVPTMDQWDIYPRQAAAAGMMAPSRAWRAWKRRGTSCTRVPRPRFPARGGCWRRRSPVWMNSRQTPGIP